MKTLNEVIKALRCTDHEADPETKCNDCPYKESHRNELWNIGPSCLDEMFADALHYLKEYQSVKAVLEFKKRQYEEMAEAILKQGQEREAFCQAEITRYQEAVKNCEETENRYLKLVHNLGKVGNDPLTWDELCKMEDTPVWLEWSSDGQWVLIAYRVDNDIKFFRYCDDRCFTLTRDEYEPDKWQAYRKERK